MMPPAKSGVEIRFARFLFRIFAVEFHYIPGMTLVSFHYI
jgi:hypothetical protein